MHKRQATLLVVLFITPLLMSAMMTPTGNIETPLVSSPDVDLKISYVEFPGPLSIGGDEMFHEMAENESWVGDGSEFTPYVIEGYSFAVDGICISFTDISVYFEIRNCYITNNGTPYPNSAIVMWNVTHGAIIDTGIYQMAYGLDIAKGPNLLIQNVTVSDMSNVGMTLIESPGLTITDCEVYDIGMNGIAVHLSNDSIIVNNHVYNCDNYGISVYHSSFCYVENNDVYSNLGSGVYLDNAHNCTIEGNTIYDNWYFTAPTCGVHLWLSDYCSIVGNDIFDNARNGIAVYGSQYANIFDNAIYNNSDHGIDAATSHNGTISQNDIHSNGWWPIILNSLCGIHLGPSTGWVIENNQIHNNTPSGITMYDDDHIVIGNDIYDNTDFGILASNADGVQVLENRIWGNGWLGEAMDRGGMSFQSCYKWWVEGNTVFNNSENGISWYGDYNTVIGNKIFNNVVLGISTFECYNNTIANNIVYGNTVGIFVVNVGTNVTGNIAFDNEYGIIMENSGSCWIYGNDFAWNDQNAMETLTFPDMPLMWYENETQIGNHWGDWSGIGIYDIYNESAIVNADIYPLRSLYLLPALPISYEVSEDWTSKQMTWQAYALHPTYFVVYVDDELYFDGEWDGEVITIVVDDLAGGMHTVYMEVYHISGHSMNATSFLEIYDLTPPEWETTPSDQETYEGLPFSYQLGAFDLSGIGGWGINGTAFDIDDTGLITNIISLVVGDYTLNISVWDPFGNTRSHIIKVHVLPEPTSPTTCCLTSTITTSTTTTTTTVSPTTSTTSSIPSPGDGFVTMMLIIGVGGGIVVIVVIIVLYKTRGR